MTTETPPIRRLVDAGELSAALRRYGTPGMYLPFIRTLSSEDVREAADRLRVEVDPDLPDRPRLVADALTKLADEAEARPISTSDGLNITDYDRHLFNRWRLRCQERSDMLDPIRNALEGLTDRDPRVEPARRILRQLADADLLLPGIDRALRPVLAKYAALQEGATR